MVRVVLMALHAFLCVGAVAAGVGFVSDPSGGALGMEVGWLEGSPFPDYWFPGLFLAVVIGGANGVSAFALGRRHRWASFASLGTGLLLVVWLAIQTVILGYQHPSQLIWWALFPTVAVLGWVLVRRDRVGH